MKIFGEIKMNKLIGIFIFLIGVFLTMLFVMAYPDLKKLLAQKVFTIQREKVAIQKEYQNQPDLMQKAMAQMNIGNLKVGDKAPDVLIINLESEESFFLLSRINNKPLVLNFGSFT